MDIFDAATAGVMTVGKTAWSARNPGSKEECIDFWFT